MKDCYGIIFDIDHFAVHDGPGIRTVIYLKGCPLRCVWCHSPESQSKEPQNLHIAERCQHCEVCLGSKCLHQALVISGKTMKASEVVDRVVQDKTFFDSSGGGVTLSGGEVLYQPEFAEALLEQLHSCGVHTIVETSGMGRWEHLLNISAYTDILYYDIKTLDNDKHLKYTGAENRIILENLSKLAARMPKGTITLRVPLIPGYNDSLPEIKAIYEFAQELSLSNIHLLRYNTSAPAKYRWLDMPYLPGELKKQSDSHMDELSIAAPKELNVTIY